MACVTKSELEAELATLITARDKVTTDLVAGNSQIEIEIRSRRVKVSDPAKFLQSLNDQIKDLRIQVCRFTNGAHNLARMRKVR